VVDTGGIAARRGLAGATARQARPRPEEADLVCSWSMAAKVRPRWTTTS
jgi:hypothetical protein